MTEEMLAGQAAPAEEAAVPAAEMTAEATEDKKAAPAPRRLRLDELKPGAQLTGTVRNTAQFGAFVDIGAEQDGLVHISELSENRVRRVEDIVKTGQAVEVTVLEVDTQRKRISLSMKPRYDVYDRPSDLPDNDEPALTPMQLAFQRAQEKRAAQQNAGKNRDKVRHEQDDILNRTLRMHKDRK